MKMESILKIVFENVTKMIIIIHLLFELLKGKLELITGGNAQTMTLQVFDKNEKLVCNVNEEERLLGSYPIDDGMRLHVKPIFTYTQRYFIVIK